MDSSDREVLRAEIAALRDCKFAYCGEHAPDIHRLVNHLLDALEAEERVTAGFKVMLKSAKARAEAAERERDALIKTIACEMGCDCCPLDGNCEGIDCEESPELGESFCRQKILEWARP